jgi:hypothetical protein
VRVALCFVSFGVAGVSVGLALFGGDYASAYSGVAYGLIGPCQGLYHGLTARYWRPPVQPAAPDDPSTPGNEPGSTA